ncbi:MAG TPA: low-complexity tail membrane protein [Cyanothece sp. UBA12306]|nr:low-complexity tail membrane protein [Cyanothece sp. UBA12306]
MTNFRWQPFLWIHLAGFAFATLTLQLVWLGLGVGEPLPLFWLELLVVGALGVFPILSMQWTRPLDIFSILFLSIRPDSLTPEQCKILSLLKTRKHRILTAIASLVLLGILWKLYQLAPLGSMTVAILPQWRPLGLLIATFAFLVSSLLILVPVGVLGILFTSPQQWSTTEPYPSDKILSDFTVFGIRLRKILPLENQTQP